jgi:hypothetical protein
VIDSLDLDHVFTVKDHRPNRISTF